MKSNQKNLPAEAGDNQAPAEMEVTAKPHRRQFTASYKLRILEMADACSPGELGALLRREGLYSSHLATWRRQRREGALDGLKPKKRGRKAKKVHPAEKQLRKLRAENARLRDRLDKAETIIAVQKKLARLLGTLDKNEDSE